MLLTLLVLVAVSQSYLPVGQSLLVGQQLTTVPSAGGGGCAYVTGDRTSSITVTCSMTQGGSPEELVDGNTTGGTFYIFTKGGNGGDYIRFYWNGVSVKITEATFYQSTADAQGDWQWQGSDDASSWTDIGSPFALGGTATEVLTELSANASAYKYYQIVRVSGITSNGPYLYEMQFKECP